MATPARAATSCRNGRSMSANAGVPGREQHQCTGEGARRNQRNHGDAVYGRGAKPVRRRRLRGHRRQGRLLDREDHRLPGCQQASPRSRGLSCRRWRQRSQCRQGGNEAERVRSCGVCRGGAIPAGVGYDVHRRHVAQRRYQLIGQRLSPSLGDLAAMMAVEMSASSCERHAVCSAHLGADVQGDRGHTPRRRPNGANTNRMSRQPPWRSRNDTRRRGTCSSFPVRSTSVRNSSPSAGKLGKGLPQWPSQRSAAQTRACAAPF